jgi:hypothetical protein
MCLASAKNNHRFIKTLDKCIKRIISSNKEDEALDKTIEKGITPPKITEITLSFTACLLALIRMIVDQPVSYK